MVCGLYNRHIIRAGNARIIVVVEIDAVVCPLPLVAVVFVIIRQLKSEVRHIYSGDLAKLDIQ